MTNIKVYYRVYDGLGKEIFASKKPSACLAFMDDNQSLLSFPLALRKITYRVVHDDCSYVLSNELICVDQQLF